MLTVHDQLVQARMVLILCKCISRSSAGCQHSCPTVINVHSFSLSTRSLDAEDLKQDWLFVHASLRAGMDSGCLPALSVEKSAKRLLNSVSSLLISGCTSAVFALLTAARDCTQEFSKMMTSCDRIS